jgi:hypothetical protein
VTSVKSVSLLFGTILFATVIQLLPLSGYYFLWRPNFLFLVTIGWIIFRPNYLGYWLCRGFGAIRRYGFSIASWIICISLRSNRVTSINLKSLARVLYDRT